MTNLLIIKSYKNKIIIFNLSFIVAFDLITKLSKLSKIFQGILFKKNKKKNNQAFFKIKIFNISMCINIWQCLFN